MEYYKKIYEGKVFAIKNDFQSAVTSYQLAFENFDCPFARDCYNAIELSVIADDTSRLNYFLEKAVVQGIRTEDLRKSGRLDRYLNTHFYKNLLEKEDSLLAIYSARVNWEIREEICQMFSDDQEIRKRYYDAWFFKRYKIGKEWEALNAKQVERLIQITETYGFPGERLIGLDRNDMHPKIRTQNYSAGMPIVILIHHFSQPNQSHDELLIKEVRMGNLYNEHFATICDFEAAYGKNKYENFGYYGLRQPPRKYDKDALNLKRAKLGILGLEQVELLNQIKDITKFWNRLY